MLNLHSSIYKRLDSFMENNRIPNLIFHGPSGSGKRNIVMDFVNNIYDNNRELMRTYVLQANCAHGKGIRFIREELKFFAKTNINFKCGKGFKTVILENADYLTTDAQSALRRCIELFSHTTRFFIIVHDKYKLLRPILSRFCEIHVPLPKINDTPISLHKYNVNICFKKNKNDTCNATSWIRNQINKYNPPTYTNLMSISDEAYEKGLSGLDILKYIETTTKLTPICKAELMLMLNIIKHDFTNEKLCMLYMLNHLLIRSNNPLKINYSNKDG